MNLVGTEFCNAFYIGKTCFFFFNIFGIVSRNVSKGGLSDNLGRFSESFDNLSWWWGRLSCSSLVVQDHSPRVTGFPLLSARAEPLCPTPHGWLSTASCGHMQSRPLPTSACRTTNQLPTHCPVLPGKSASPPLRRARGTGVALMGVGGGNGRWGLTSLTASPAPSSCPCVLGEHHRLNCPALRNTLSWKPVASSQEKWLICILLCVKTGVFPFMLCPFHEAKWPCFWTRESQFPACLSLLCGHPHFFPSNYLIYFLIIEL